VIKRAPDFGIELVTLGQAADGAQLVDREIERSSWGRNKTLETWDAVGTTEMIWNQRAAELALEHALAGGASDEEVAQTARAELLALQTSDWAYMENVGLTGDYGATRFAEHLAAFERALNRLNA
jgi:predicted glycosyl hydrolase (DUF1957 family)